MATKIIHKKSSVAEKVPLTTDLEVGEIAINLADKLLYTKNSAGEVIVIGGGVWANGDVGFEVKNQTGSTIPKGTLVGFVGTVGSSGRLLVAPYLANGSQPSEYAVGLTRETIVDGADGIVIDHGKISGLNTSAWAAGTILYASASSAGQLTSTRPLAPNNKIVVAAVVNSSVNAGTLEVRMTLGSSLSNDELVELSTLSNGQTLIYNSTTGRFENSLAAGSGTVTSVAATAGTGISVSGSPITTSGTLTITNTAPDLTVSLTGAGATSVTGTYPNFTISSTDTNTTYSAGNGISLSTTTFSVAAGTGLTQEASGLALAAITAGAATVGALRYNGTTQVAGQFYGGTTNPTNTTRLNYSGNLHLTDLQAIGNVNTTSDERLKTNWQALPENFLDNLAKVKYGVYDRIDNGITQAGVSAQDLQKVLPEVVQEDSEGTLSVNYGNSALVAVIELTKLVKQLQEEIKQLKAE
jgi:hypothetical protein